MTIAKIIINSERLTDGSHVWDVDIVLDDQRIHLNCYTQDDAVKLAQGISGLVSKHSLTLASVEG